MCPRSWRGIKFWPISIPISSRSFSPSTRSIRREPVPDAFWLLPYTWRSRAERGLSHFSKLVCAKGRRPRDSRCHFSRRLFYHRQLDMGVCRRNELALSAVAGNSHSDSGPSAPQKKTVLNEKPPVFGHISSAERNHSRDRGRRVCPRRGRGMGLGRLSAIFPTIL